MPQSCLSTGLLKVMICIIVSKWTISGLHADVTKPVPSITEWGER